VNRPARTRLILWRHGQTDWNVDNRFQGQANIPLNDVGRAQARAAADALVALRPDAIVSSPLDRARVTAQALADRTGLGVETDDRLKEIDVGSWEGLLIADVTANDPEFARALASGRDWRRSPTGETSIETGARVAGALRELANDFAGRTLVVASHGLAIRMGTAHVLGWDFRTSLALGPMFNCGWTVLSHANGKWALVTWNQSVLPKVG